MLVEKKVIRKEMVKKKAIPNISLASTLPLPSLEVPSGQCDSWDHGFRIHHHPKGGNRCQQLWLSRVGFVLDEESFCFDSG